MKAVKLRIGSLLRKDLPYVTLQHACKAVLQCRKFIVIF